MSTFPVLSTGAVAQYPLEYLVQHRTQAVAFLSGASQRYRVQGQPRRRWVIRLDLLSDSELAALITFTEQQGTEPFAFSDPVTGANALKCVIGRESFRISGESESNGKASVTIEETQ